MNRDREFVYTHKNITVRKRQNNDYESFVLGYDKQMPSQRKYDKGHRDMSFVTRDWYYERLKLWDSLAETDVAYLFGIFKHSDGKMVGYCDLATQNRENYQIGVIGYTIFNSHWKNVYAKEAIEAMTDIGFSHLGYRYLEAHIHLDNHASNHTILSAGFKYEGTREKYSQEEEKWIDHEVYTLYNPKNN